MAKEALRFNKDDIRKTLPQSEPILLADSATVVPMERAVTEVYIDPDWDVFRGHFPSMQMLPGVYLTESLAQAADLMLLAAPGNADALPMLFAVNQMRFLRPVYPGEHVRCEVALAAQTADDLFDCKVTAYCEEKRVAVGRLTLALRKYAVPESGKK